LRNNGLDFFSWEEIKHKLMANHIIKKQDQIKRETLACFNFFKPAYVFYKGYVYSYILSQFEESSEADSKYTLKACDIKDFLNLYYEQKNSKNSIQKKLNKFTRFIEGIMILMVLILTIWGTVYISILMKFTLNDFLVLPVGIIMVVSSIYISKYAKRFLTNHSKNKDIEEIYWLNRIIELQSSFMEMLDFVKYSK
jgi:hypothetical protein